MTTNKRHQGVVRDTREDGGSDISTLCGDVEIEWEPFRGYCVWGVGGCFSG